MRHAPPAAGTRCCPIIYPDGRAPTLVAAQDSLPIHMPLSSHLPCPPLHYPSLSAPSSYLNPVLPAFPPFCSPAVPPPLPLRPSSSPPTFYPPPSPFVIATVAPYLPVRQCCQKRYPSTITMDIKLMSSKRSSLRITKQF